MGSMILSIGAIAVREIEASSSWQIMFFRSIGLITGASLLFAVRNRGRIRETMSNGALIALYAGPCLGIASTFYILALTHTTIANAMMTFSSTPLIVAGMAWLFMRERIRRETIVAIMVAATGIAVMSTDSIASGTGLGTLFALGNASAFAAYLVLLRYGSRGSDVDLLPAVLVAAVITGAAGLIGSRDLQVPFRDMAICFLWGFGIQNIGSALIMAAARRVMAAELSLVFLFESIAGPTWVWLLFGEHPGSGTIAGGLLTVTTMAVWFWFRIRTERDSGAGDRGEQAVR